MHARLLCTKSFLTLYQIINETDFPYLADEIAEPRPDMNIKVAAFTVSEKSSNMCNLTANMFRVAERFTTSTQTYFFTLLVIDNNGQEPRNEKALLIIHYRLRICPGNSRFMCVSNRVVRALSLTCVWNANQRISKPMNIHLQPSNAFQR